MTIINRVGGGAGGAGGLNFTVRAYSETPTGSAAENTIGVVTDTAISGWKMQVEQPTGTGGLVWIEVSSISSVAFYADKKELVKLYPVSVRQYVDGAWSNVDAYIYQDDSWVQFSNQIIILLDSTGFKTAHGGGFSQGFKTSSGTCSVTIGTNTLKVSALYKSGNGYVTAANNDPIDLTKISTLSFTVSEYDAGGSSYRTFCRIGPVRNDDRNGNVSAQVASLGISGAGTHIIDLSSVTGEHYILFDAWGDTSSLTVHYTVSEIKLIPQG